MRLWNSPEIKHKKFNLEASDSKTDKGKNNTDRQACLVSLFPHNQHRTALLVLYLRLSERVERSESLYFAFGPALIPLLCR